MDFTQNITYDISQLHHKAKRCLVLRQFEEAVQICCEVLDQQENGDKSPFRPDDERVPAERWTVPFVVIAIQAYAELNQCQIAVRFASKVFGNAVKFPPEVLELCICLLLKASKHAEADELAEKWLHCEDNFYQQKYLEITELYVKYVLLPQGLHEKIQQFLETNKALSSEQRQVIIDAVRMSENENKVGCSSDAVGRDTSSEVTDLYKPEQKQGVRSIVVMRMLSVMNKLQRLCWNISFSRQKTSTILRILILVFFIYTLLTATGYQGMTSGSGIFIFWQAVLKAWRAMFSPYHLM